MNPLAGPVIVVDDDPGVCRSFSRLLRVLGLSSLAFPSGDALLASDPTPVPGLVLLDLHLPGLRGAPLIARLAERWPAVPIVVMTGLDHPGLEDEVIAAGAASFLTKPVDKRRLVGLIDSLSSA